MWVLRIFKVALCSGEEGLYSEPFSVALGVGLFKVNEREKKTSIVFGYDYSHLSKLPHCDLLFVRLLSCAFHLWVL